MRWAPGTLLTEHRPPEMARPTRRDALLTSVAGAGDWPNLTAVGGARRRACEPLQQVLVRLRSRRAGRSAAGRMSFLWLPLRSAVVLGH